MNKGGAIEMDAATADLLKAIATDAIKIMAPAAITAYVGYRTVKHQFDIERVRLHEKDSVDAHKRLLKFARELRNDTFPLAEDKRRGFKDLMSKCYIGQLELDYVYFSEEATQVLDILEEQYVCLTRSELISEIDPDEEKEFVERKLFVLADELAVYVKRTMKAKGVSA
jgi:hypothetical protein